MYTNAYTERNLLQKKMDLKSVEQAVVMNQKWVPYPTYIDRAGWDKLFGEDKDNLIRLGEKRLDYQWRVVKATDYIEFERSGSREIMQNPFDENNRAMSQLIVAELAEGKGRFLDQIINGVYFDCEMTSWALSAHLDAQRAKCSLPSYKEHIIELTSGEMGAMLSWTYYFFHKEFDKVNPLISERLRSELQKRILDTYMNEDRFWWMAFNYKPGQLVNNWNPWCNFNVLQCFFLLENNREVLAKAVYRSMLSVDHIINYTNADGACEEGPIYWGHAAGKLYDYLKMLSDGTAGKVSIFNEPIIKNMGEYISRVYVGNDWVVNFADASAKGGGLAPLIFRYGKAVGSTEMTQFASYLNKNSDAEQKRKNNLSFSTDLYRGLQTYLYQDELEKEAPVHANAPTTWFPQTQVCCMTDKSGFFFAAKAGHNNESHNHNDVGTFSLYLNKTPMLIDAGVGTYTRQTFSGERYSIWSMQSNYHNLPMINGVPQKFGANYKGTNVQFDAKAKRFTADISTAYPQQAKVDKWVRSYTLNKGRLIIKDDFELKETVQNNELHFLVWGKVDAAELGKIKLTVDQQSVAMLYDKNAFTVNVETVPLTDSRLTNVWGKEIYRIVLRAIKKEQKGNYKVEILNTEK